MRKPVSTTHKVLIVDDDDNDLRLTLNALKLMAPNLSVQIAHDGLEAIDCLQRRGGFEQEPPGNPVMILLDLHMPCANGLDFLRGMKRDSSLRAIPVVVFTTSSRENDVRESYELGANAYVVKPMDYDDFVETVRQISDFWFRRNCPPPDRSPMVEHATSHATSLAN